MAVCAAKHFGYSVKNVINDKITGSVSVFTTSGKNSKTETAASLAIMPNNNAQINTGWFNPIGANNGAKAPQIANKIDWLESLTNLNSKENRANKTMTNALRAKAIKIFLAKIAVCRSVSSKHFPRFGNDSLMHWSSLGASEIFGTNITTTIPMMIQIK